MNTNAEQQTRDRMKLNLKFIKETETKSAAEPENHEQICEN